MTTYLDKFYAATEIFRALSKQTLTLDETLSMYFNEDETGIAQDSIDIIYRIAERQSNDRYDYVTVITITEDPEASNEIYMGIEISEEHILQDTDIPDYELNLEDIHEHITCTINSYIPTMYLDLTDEAACTKFYKELPDYIEYKAEQDMQRRLLITHMRNELNK